MASGRSKRISKRSVSPLSSSLFPSKRRRPQTPGVGFAEEADSTSSSPSSYSVVSEVSVYQNGQFPFKDPNFEHSGVNSSRKKMWKNLKQIMSIERALPWKQDDPTYSSIDAPPSFKPAKKYSDMSGLPAKLTSRQCWSAVIPLFPVAKYKDPRTGIQYSNSTEFSTIRSLPMDIANGYLALRKAAPT